MQALYYSVDWGLMRADSVWYYCAMRDMSFPEEEQMQTDAALQIGEKKVSPTSQKLIRQGFAKNPKQAQVVLIIIFILTLLGSGYLLYISEEFQPQEKPVEKNPYTRPIPGR